MDKYIYTKVEYREEDGEMVKYVFVPLEGEWMDIETFYFNKRMWEDAMKDARRVWDEHGSDC